MENKDNPNIFDTAVEIHAWQQGLKRGYEMCTANYKWYSLFGGMLGFLIGYYL